MARKQGGGPAWLATFADMMSLLMAFFVMLFAMSTIEVEKYEAVVQSMTEAFGHGQDMTASQKQYFQQTKTQTRRSDNTGTAEKTAIEELKPLYQSLIETYASEIRKGQLKIELEDNGRRLRITFPNSTAFPSGRAELTGAFLDMIEKLPDWRNQPVTIKVLGHTDPRPIRSTRFRNNWELSAARAASVIDALVAFEKIEPSQAMAIGLADTRPVDPRNTPSAWRKNRRVEILVESRAADADPSVPADISLKHRS